MNWTIVPVLLPLATALICIFWGRPGDPRRVFVGVSATVQLVAAILLAERAYQGQTFLLAMGDWSAPVGILLVIDRFSGVMLVLSSLISLASTLYGYAEIRPTIAHPLRLPLSQFMIAGVNLSFCTGDLFNLFVAFEVMLISSYALLTLEADDWDIKQAFPYLAINLVGSTLFICAAGLAYALFGSLNFADIAARSAGMSDDPRVLLLALLLLVTFAIKAGLFPLYYWLPNSYPTLPFPLAALYGGLLTKVGVYVLLRIFGTVLPHNLTAAHQMMAWLAGLTMLLAVMGAISRNFIRGILSYHILSQIGFMVLAIGFFTPLSIAGSIFYIIHHILVKSSLFLIGGVAFQLNRTDNLDKMGNLWIRAPWLGVLFLLQALSLAGVPPLSGFWGKYVILLEGLRSGEYLLVSASVIASILTLFSMLKIWNSAFWTASDAPVHSSDRRWVNMTLVVAGLTLMSVAIGLGAEGVMRISIQAANQVLDQPAYIDAAFSHAGKGTPIPR